MHPSSTIGALVISSVGLALFGVGGMFGGFVIGGVLGLASESFRSRGRLRATRTRA